ncbi:MAG: ZIP family metal transporter [Candidatus Woesearchaeota archaeon]
MGAVLYSILSVILVSVIAIIAIIPFLFKKKIPNSHLMMLLSLSVGTLLGGVFIHFLPEIVEHGYTLNSASYILLGFLTFFVLERFIHWHHNNKELKHCDDNAHSHAYHLAPLNLIGDGLHNFLDGLVIAGSYIVSIPLGIAATISIIFHEIPQEVADFGVLLYSGMSKMKAVLFNFLSAVTAIIGVIIGLILAGKTHGFTTFIIPFAAGNFIYIAGSNLVPELHRHCKFKDSILHVIAIIIGILIMVGITFLEVAH